MTVYDLEKTNFITILRSGAFDDSKPIGMLSDFKWNKLIELAHIHDVVNIFAQGLEHYYYDDNLNLSESHLGKIRTLLQETPTHTIPELYDIDKVHLHSTALESKLREIVGQEQKDTERSFETLQLAAILFENVNHILSGRSFLRGGRTGLCRGCFIAGAGVSAGRPRLLQIYRRNLLYAPRKM